jgi:RNA polymerase sigma-70 factor (ECF subfamily)
MDEAADDFADLLARARAGDEEAAARLAQQYEPKVRIVARVLLGPALRPYLDSMDLVQSVHRSLLRGLRQDKFDLPAPDNLVALAVTLVRHKVARQWSRHRRQQRLEVGQPGSEGLPQLLVSLSSPQPGPAQVAELQDAVQHLCSSLNETDRRILERRLDGHQTAEIAQELGLSPVALRVRLSRLRQRLQDSGVLADWL